jgi:hypothetical protein
MTSHGSIGALAALVFVLATLHKQEVNLESLPQLRVVEEARIGKSADPNLGLSIRARLSFPAYQAPVSQGFPAADNARIAS